MAILEARDIEVFRGEKRVLNGLSLVVEEGEKVCIAGSNGSGKTTLLESLLGFIPINRGTILFRGKPLKEEKDFQGFRPLAGYVFQEPDNQLFSPTVEEELAFGPLNIGVKREKIPALVEKTLKSLGIEHLKGATTFHLSGGEKRLVALATVVIMDPPLLLLDETTTGLDPRHQKTVFEFLKRTEKSVVLVTHDRETREVLGWKTYTLQEGRLRLS